MTSTAIANSSYFASPSTVRDSHRSSPSAWQMVILPRPARGTTLDSSAAGLPAELRMDGPHGSLPMPHYILNWSDIVGVHPSSTLDLPFERPRSLQLEYVRTATVPTAVASALRDAASVLAEAAHEVRTPIAGALQALMMVTQRKPGQVLEARELDLLRAAQVRLLHANHWAEDILSERNLNDHYRTSIRQRFYPDQWRQELLPIVQSAADKHQVRLVWEGWDRSLPRLYLDVNHLSRVVMNLVINAIQASPKGATVTVRAAAQSNLSQRLLLSIEDRGVGMDAQLMRKVNSSQPWTADVANSRTQGLGLRTVKTLTDAIGGSISVQRGAQGGTMFRIALPVDDLRLLVRQWLMRGAAEQRCEPDSRLAIYSIKANDMDAALVDRQLQLATSETTFVYRIGLTQWMWLQLSTASAAAADDIHSLTSRLNEFGQRSQSKARCHADLICRLNELPFVNTNGNHDEAPRLRGLLETIHGHALRLMDGRVPPLDLVTTQVSAPVSEPTTSDSGAVITRTAKTDGTTRTIQEVAKQWRMIHSKLEKLHSRHVKSAPAM